MIGGLKSSVYALIGIGLVGLGFGGCVQNSPTASTEDARPVRTLEWEPADGLTEMNLNPSRLLVRIDFRPEGQPEDRFFFADHGETFGVRLNGQFYGWNRSLVGNTFQRLATVPSQPAYSTGIASQAGVGRFFWEYALPVGTYRVDVVCGDAEVYESIYGVIIENVRVPPTTPSKATPWVRFSREVNVIDGRLTIQNHPEARNNKIVLVEIRAR